MPTSSPPALSPALEKLTHFVLSATQRPADESWVRNAFDAWFAGDERTVFSWEQSSVCGYLAHGHTDKRNERMIDRFLNATPGSLSPAERDALDVVRAHAYVSLFELVEADPEAGLTMTDRVSGEQLLVQPKPISGAAEGDHLLAWLVPIGGHIELLGPVCHVPPRHVSTIEAAIREARRRHFTTLQRGLPWRGLPAVHRALRDALRADQPAFEHDNGEPILLCRAIYEVRAIDEVRAALAACPELTADASGRYHWRPEGARGQSDAAAEIEVRTVRLSVTTRARSRLAEARRFVERLLGKRARHRVDRFEDPRGLPLADGEQAASRSRPSADREALATDVETAIAGFQRRLDAHIGGAEPREAPPEIDPAARVHRLPPAGHEIMQALVPGLGDLVRDASARLRRSAGAEALIVDQEDLLSIPGVEGFLHVHVDALVARGWERADAVGDAKHLACHVLTMINHALHGKKIFWVDESLAWMLAETDLDIIGRCLRLPFPACAFMFTDRGTLDVAESLLSQETVCSLRGRTLRVMSAYVTRARPAAEDEPQVVDIVFLFDAAGDKWPYLVSRELFVEPDQHLDGILDSQHPLLSGEERDPIFLAPELKKLVHLVINAILYATSAHLAPILLSSKLRRLEQSMKGKGPRKRAPLQRQLSGLRGACSSEEVFHLPGHIDISKIKRLRDLPKTETGRTLMKRFAVRGHWRRPNPDWQDQRLRWIEPYWKGPELAVAIERGYRMRP